MICSGRIIFEPLDDMYAPFMWLCDGNTCMSVRVHALVRHSA